MEDCLQLSVNMAVTVTSYSLAACLNQVANQLRQLHLAAIKLRLHFPLQMGWDSLRAPGETDTRQGMRALGAAPHSRGIPQAHLGLQEGTSDPK